MGLHRRNQPVRLAVAHSVCSQGPVQVPASGRVTEWFHAITLISLIPLRASRSRDCVFLPCSLTALLSTGLGSQGTTWWLSPKS